jgi:hypothetical protein
MRLDKEPSFSFLIAHPSAVERWLLTIIAARICKKVSANEGGKAVTLRRGFRLTSSNAAFLSPLRFFCIENNKKRYSSHLRRVQYR